MPKLFIVRQEQAPSQRLRFELGALKGRRMAG
jgi:hypothetical protein